VTIALGILAVVSFALYVWQFVLGITFRSRRREEADSPGVPTNPPPHVGGYDLPGITVLKPLKGIDPETEACLRTWREQDYPGPVQMLFGVAAADDPAAKLVDAVVCPERLGANAKVSTLAQLEPLIKHELVVISDADAAVPKDFLKTWSRSWKRKTWRWPVASTVSRAPATSPCDWRRSW